MKRKRLKCYDVCCGAAVFSLGFQKAGFKILGGIDIDKHAIKTAKRNLPYANWRPQSIQELSKFLKRNTGHLIYSADVILAGLPCQGFSVAGNRDPDDKRNELFKYLLRIVKMVQPEFVVIENVQGLLSETNKKVFSKIVDGLKKLNYDVDHRLYDAANFGTPQHRKRVFIIASKGSKARFIFEGIRFEEERQNVRDALKGLPARRQIKKHNHTFMVHSSRVEKRIKEIRGTNIISYRRLKWNKPSLTIISGHNALPVHPKENRAISIREAARIQGIPDSFVFEGPRTEQTVQVANAVPFPMAFHTARAIKNSQLGVPPNEGALYKRLSSRLNGTGDLLRKGFVAYYKKNGREFPWRKTANHHEILLTEALLQRTKGEMVNGQWKKIVNTSKLTGEGYRLNRRILQSAVRKLGIFSRADSIRNIFATLHQYFRNNVPQNFDELKNIPGVGNYIASAVRTFAFNIPDFPVDSNAFRFVQRFFGVDVTGKKSEARQIREFMNTIIDKRKPKEFVYGFLDFCAQICKPRNPNCHLCFLKEHCRYGFNRARKSASFSHKAYANGATLSNRPV